MASDRGVATELEPASSSRSGSRCDVCTSPATHCCAAPIDGGRPPRGGARARRRRARQRRPLRVDADPRRSGRPIPRRARGARAGRRLRERARVGDRRRRVRLAPTAVIKRGSRGMRRRRRANGSSCRRRRGGRRRDRRRRRARGGLPRRRRRARVGGGGALRREARERCRDPRLGRGARGGRGAVVALETTLVAHGFPPGEGVAVGLESERRVREAGAVPATIGVLDGEIRVGPDRGRARSASTRRRAKVGPRDLAACAVQGAVGATTVGGTLAVCRAAGIRVHGDRRHRRRAPRLPDTAGRLGRPRRARAHAGTGRVRRSQVAARRAGDGRGAGDARRPGARLPDGRAAALLRRRAAGRPSRRASSRPAEAAAVAAAHWDLGGRRAPARPAAGREPRRRRAADRGRAGGGARDAASPGRR